jgi:ParB-like chromosome segregation protein Spo0J
MLSENGQREALTPLEEATAYAEVLALPGMDTSGFARQLGRPPAEIDGRLALLRLPKPARKLLANGSLTYAEALLLTELAEHPEDVTAALQKHARGFSIAQAVSDVRSHRERQTRAEATRAALEAKGVRIVDSSARTTAAGPTARRLGSGFGAVNIKHSVHRKQPCHAATIGFDGSAVYVCTDPKRHVDDKRAGVEAEPDAKAQRAATRAANQARRAATAARATKVRELLASADPVDVDYVCRALVVSAPLDIAKSALAPLHLDVSDDTAWDRERRALVTYAATGTDHMRRAALALQLAAAEREANAHPDRALTGRMVPPYLDYLIANGYEELPGDATLRERHEHIAREAA